MKFDDLIGTKEAAEILGLSQDHVKLLCRQGKIEARQIGKTWIMDRNNLTIRKDEPTMFEKLNPSNSTIFECEGKELRTIQDPYLDDDVYKAIAVDENNNEYEVIWEINHPDFEHLEDESEACDWDNPIQVTKL